MKLFHFHFFVTYSITFLIVLALVLFDIVGVKSIGFTPYFVACFEISYVFAKEYARPMTGRENIRFSILSSAYPIIVEGIFIFGFSLFAVKSKEFGKLAASIGDLPVFVWFFIFVLMMFIYFIMAIICYAIFTRINNEIIEKVHERLTSRSSGHR